MAEPASAESDDKPRREVMTRYMCLLAVDVLPSADIVPSTEVLITVSVNESTFCLPAVVLQGLLRLAVNFNR